MADEHYEEIGRSLAALVVEGGMGPTKAWSLLGGLNLYRKWMLPHWIDRYREEAPSAPRRLPRAPGRPISTLAMLRPLDAP